MCNKVDHPIGVNSSGNMCCLAMAVHTVSDNFSCWHSILVRELLKIKCLYLLKTCRVRIGKGPAVRDLNPNRKTALELSVRAYAEKRNGTVVKPTIGTSFDSIDEAYEFYNLYSWECGFGVRLSSSRLNVDRNKAMQEIVCACAVRVNLWLRSVFFSSSEFLMFFKFLLMPAWNYELSSDWHNFSMCGKTGQTTKGEHPFNEMWLHSYD